MQKPQGESVSGVHTESETTGKVITCKGECLSRDITESNWLIWWIIQENNSFFFFFFWGWSCCCAGSGTALCHRGNSSWSPSENGGSSQDPLYFNLPHWSQLLEGRGMPSLHKNSQLSYNSLANLLTSMYLLLQSEAYRVYPRILGHEAAG